MSYGEKIASLRKSKGMTQASLGAELNVTYQAVSKWERDESDPDFATMCKLARLFGVPLTFFENADAALPESEQPDEEQVAEENSESEQPAEEQAEEEQPAAETDAEDTETAEQETAVAVAAPLPAPVEQPEPERLIGVCSVCGKSIYNTAELGESRPKLVCKPCKTRIEEQKAQAERNRIENEKRKKAYALESAHKRRNRGLIVSAIITVILLVIGLVGSISIGEDPLIIALGCVVEVIFLYTFIAQLFWGGVVRDLCLTGGKWVGMPGVIFSLDLDGIIFLIAVKILFAVLRFLLFILILLFFVFLSIVISPFAFIPQLIKLNRGEEP